MVIQFGNMIRKTQVTLNVNSNFASCGGTLTCNNSVRGTWVQTLTDSSQTKLSMRQNRELMTRDLMQVVNLYGHVCFNVCLKIWIFACLLLCIALYSLIGLCSLVLSFSLFKLCILCIVMVIFCWLYFCSLLSSLSC